MKGWVDRKWNLGVVLTSLRTRTRRNLEVEVSRKLSPSWVISWHHPPPHQSPTYVAFPPFERGEGALGVGQLITSSDVWGEMVNRPRLSHTTHLVSPLPRRARHLGHRQAYQIHRRIPQEPRMEKCTARMDYANSFCGLAVVLRMLLDNSHKNQVSGRSGRREGYLLTPH